MTTSNSNAGKRVACSRCAAPCVVAGTRNDEARIGSYANGAGVCANCFVSTFLKQLTAAKGPYGAGCFSNFTAQSLRLPHVQEQFRALLTVGCADIRFDSIDWDEVVANWDLSIDGGKAGLFS